MAQMHRPAGDSMTRCPRVPGPRELPGFGHSTCLLSPGVVSPAHVALVAAGNPFCDKTPVLASRLLPRKVAGVEPGRPSARSAVSDAPRGSTYHHFRAGKSELHHAALDRVSARSLAQLEATRGQPAPVVLERFSALWRQLLDYSGLRAGCAVVSVAVAPAGEDMLDHTGTIFRTWVEQMTDLFTVGGMAAEGAKRPATLAIAATEGAAVMAPAERRREPFDLVARMLTEMAGSRRRDRNPPKAAALSIVTTGTDPDHQEAVLLRYEEALALR